MGGVGESLDDHRLHVLIIDRARRITDGARRAGGAVRMETSEALGDMRTL